MTTNRIYKPRKTVEEALQELEDLSGSQFNPEVVVAGLKTLRHVEIPPSIDQLPKNEMEQRRFSHFFSDKLTGLYNEDYLQIILRNNQSLRRYHCLHSLHVNNLQQYNRSLGWEKGNLLMKHFTAELQSRYPDALLFRAYGRDFVIVTADHFDLDADSLIFDCLLGTGVTLNSNHIDLSEESTYSIDKLEHLEIFCDLQTCR